MLAHAYAHLAGGDIFLDPGTCNAQAKDPYGAGGEHRSPCSPQWLKLRQTQSSFSALPAK